VACCAISSFSRLTMLAMSPLPMSLAAWLITTWLPGASAPTSWRTSWYGSSWSWIRFRIAVRMSATGRAKSSMRAASARIAKGWRRSATMKSVRPSGALISSARAWHSTMGSWST
jgi:hypothetical protein